MRTLLRAALILGTVTFLVYGACQLGNAVNSIKSHDAGVGMAGVMNLDR